MELPILTFESEDLIVFGTVEGAEVFVERKDSWPVRVAAEPNLKEVPDADQTKPAREHEGRHG